MRKFYLLIAIVLLTVLRSEAQTAADYAVQLSVSTQTAPPQITLKWKKINGATGFSINRKAKAATSWVHIGNAAGTDSTYVDQNVVADSAYEYEVQMLNASQATGYIYAGIKAPATHSRGTMILLVDSTFVDSCRTEIAQLMNDLRGDGWGVIRHNVGRNAAVTSVKSMIVADYQSRPGVSALLLLGHIPVPYSGEINPDGHPDHLGAWPADVYYSDIDGQWTDVSINDTLASRPQNRNKPGDGKWDQSVLTTPVELQTGRIDFANMPAFAKTEVQLMKSYLNKDHIFKMDSLTIIRKGVIDDNFGAFSGEAFAANGWRLFPTILGSNHIIENDFETTLKDSAYMWAYGCGGGSYNSAGGIGSTSDFATKPIKGVFAMLFGSYFGDWDAQNSFLRAPLCAQEPALTCAWAGRPNWFLHHMALGETIGYGTALTQNNSGLYNNTNFGASFVHIALMGDPSLRTDYIKPPASLSVAPVTNAGANLSWIPSPDASVIGYYVYRSDTAYGSYTKISNLLTTTSFSDVHGVNGKKYYIVRPVKLQQTPSGSYYNLGIGIVDSALVSYPLAVPTVNRTQQIVLFPNPATSQLYAMVDYTSKASEMQFDLINATGYVIESGHKAVHAGQNTLVWDVSALPAGVYLLIARTAEGIITRTWTKTGDK